MTESLAGLLLDIDGVLTVSWQALPGAVEALAKVRDARVRLRLVTNTTELTRRELVAALDRAGFAIQPDEIVTALVATGGLLRTRYPGARCFVIGGADPTDDLDGVNVVDGSDGADVVIIGGASEAILPDLANRALRLVLAGVPLVAMHGSLTWLTSEGIVLDMGGALVRALEQATGSRATVVGKPSPEFFEAALEMLGLPADRVAMVGDDLATDVLAAQRVGLTGVLVRTGKFRQEDLDRSDERPDFVVDSVADVPKLVGLA